MSVIWLFVNKKGVGSIGITWVKSLNAASFNQGRFESQINESRLNDDHFLQLFTFAQNDFTLFEGLQLQIVTNWLQQIIVHNWVIKPLNTLAEQFFGKHQELFIVLVILLLEKLLQLWKVITLGHMQLHQRRIVVTLNGCGSRYFQDVGNFAKYLIFFYFWHHFNLIGKIIHNFNPETAFQHKKQTLGFVCFVSLLATKVFWAQLNRL